MANRYKVVIQALAPDGNRASEALDILVFEFLLGPVEQHAQILPVYAELPADLIAIALIEKHCLQQQPVARGKFEQNLPDLVLDLPGSRDVQGIWARSRRFGPALLIERLAAAGGAKMLKKHIVANRVDKGSEALRLTQASSLRTAARTRAKVSWRTSSMA